MLFFANYYMKTAITVCVGKYIQKASDKVNIVTIAAAKLAGD